MYPQDPPPYPQDPNRQYWGPQQSDPNHSNPPYPEPQYPGQQYPGYPAQQSYPPTLPAQSYGPGYPPYQQDGYQQLPPYPQQGYYQGYAPGPAAPAKRTEFGWASIIVSSIALLFCWVPYLNMVGTLAAMILVVAGWLGKHERSRIPAAFGTAIALLALIGTVIFALLWRDVLDQFFTGFSNGFDRSR